jgi:hypothetical protein
MLPIGSTICRLVLLDLRSGAVRTLYHAPRYGSIQQQLAMPAASPSGAHVGVIQGISSDRGVVAGDLQLMVADTGEVVAVDTRQVDVAHLAWRDKQTLVFAGLRELESVAREVHAPTAPGWRPPPTTGLSGYGNVEQGRQKERHLFMLPEQPPTGLAPEEPSDAGQRTGEV